ncbi:SWI/SNF complex component SNF12, partial [Tetrabaena socialis]
PPREAIEVRRLGGRSCRATILIHPDYQPERYVLPPKLAEVLGMMGHETRSRVMVALYGFIKSRRLQARDPQEPINVNLTSDLEKVFGTPSIKLSELGTRLSALLVPVPPVQIEYDIRLRCAALDLEGALRLCSRSDNLRPLDVGLVNGELVKACDCV